MGVLQDALGVVRHRHPQQPGHPLVPGVGEVVDRQRALDQRQLQLEAQDDVQVVRRLVRLDADQRRLHGVDRAVERPGVDLAEPTGQRTQPRQQPGAERPRAPDDVLPHPALRLVHAERDRIAQRRARERRVGRRLVEAMAELVQDRVQRDAEVLLVVLGGDADVAGGQRLGERMHGGVQAPAIRVVADRVEEVEHRRALRGDRVRAREHAVVAGLVGVAGRRHQRHQRLAQLGEQRLQLGGGEPRLEVVEQRVVGVLVALEAGDVALAQLDLALERVAEAREVGRGQRLLPRLQSRSSAHGSSPPPARSARAPSSRSRGVPTRRAGRRRRRGPGRPPTARARSAGGRAPGRSRARAARARAWRPCPPARRPRPAASSCSGPTTSARPSSPGR